MPETCDNAIGADRAGSARATAVKAVILAAAFIMALYTPLTLLVREWGSPDFSHGILVPFVSLYFIWMERERLKGIPVRPNYVVGIIFIAAAALIIVLGKAGRVQVAQEAAILLIIPGLVSLLFGRGYLRALRFPLFYLAFMVPLINPFLDRIYWPFQIITAKFSAMLLPHLGVPVYRRMQFLELPDISLEVARGCSGLKFMMSVYAIAIPLAYFTQKGWTRKIVLMVLAFIIGILTNVVRVTLVGVWTYFKLGDAVHGPYHLLQGYFVSIVGFIVLFLTSIALSRFRYASSTKAGKIYNAPAAGEWPITIMKAPFFTALALLAGIGLYMHFFAITPVPLARPLDQIPLSIGEWSAADINDARTLVKAPGASQELTRLYVKSSGRKAILYIGYFDSQMDGDGVVNDYFGDFNEGVEEAEVPDVRGSMRVNRKIMVAGKSKYLVLFWYDLNGSTLTNMHRVKFETAYNALIHGRSNGAVIMVISEIKGEEGINEAFHDGVSLAQGVRPLLRGFFLNDRQPLM